jgi:hypothetical protein
MDGAALAPDSGSPPSGDAGDLAPCLSSSPLFYVDGDPGNPIVVGTATATSAEGPWQGTLTSEWLLQLTVGDAIVNPGDYWRIQLAPSSNASSLMPGEYVDAESPSRGPILGVIAGGKTCPDQLGQFDLVDLQTTVGGEAVVRVLVSFELSCASGGGKLHGCVSYQQ